MKKLFAVLLFVAVTLSQANAALDLSVFTIRGFEGKGPLEFNAPEELLLLQDGRILLPTSVTIACRFLHPTAILPGRFHNW